jgi:hypothetical protein
LTFTAYRNKKKKKQKKKKKKQKKSKKKQNKIYSGPPNWSPYERNRFLVRNADGVAGRHAQKSTFFFSKKREEKKKRYDSQNAALSRPHSPSGQPKDVFRSKFLRQTTKNRRGKKRKKKEKKKEKNEKHPLSVSYRQLRQQIVQFCFSHYCTPLRLIVFGTA